MAVILLLVILAGSKGVTSVGLGHKLLLLISATTDIIVWWCTLRCSSIALDLVLLIAGVLLEGLSLLIVHLAVAVAWHDRTLRRPQMLHLLLVYRGLIILVAVLLKVINFFIHWITNYLLTSPWVFLNIYDSTLILIIIAVSNGWAHLLNTIVRILTLGTKLVCHVALILLIDLLLGDLSTPSGLLTHSKFQEVLNVLRRQLGWGATPNLQVLLLKMVSRAWGLLDYVLLWILMSRWLMGSHLIAGWMIWILASWILSWANPTQMLWVRIGLGVLYLIYAANLCDCLIGARDL